MHEGQALDGTKVMTRFNSLMAHCHRDIKERLVLHYTTPPLVIPVGVDRGVLWVCRRDTRAMTMMSCERTGSTGRAWRTWPALRKVLRSVRQPWTRRVVCNFNVCLCVYDHDRANRWRIPRPRAMPQRRKSMKKADNYGGSAQGLSNRSQVRALILVVVHFGNFM